LLAKCEKPEKRIKEYLSREFPDQERLDNRIDMFNKSYKSFFAAYFRKFAGELISECIMEAYIAALDSLKRGVDLEVAISIGYQAGVRFHRRESNG
jgi:hypothetical protein